MVTIISTAYPATIATLALGWQIYSWHRTHKTRVRVKICDAVMAAAWGGVQRMVSIEAANDNDHAIRVTGFGIVANDGSGLQLFIMDPVRGSTLPGQIPAHDSATGFQPWDALVGSPIDFKKPVVAFVHVAGGDRFVSKPVRLAA